MVKASNAEPAPASETPEPATATKKNLSLQERIDVIDWIRTRIDPVFCDTWVSAAKAVSEATGVEVSASQISYILSELPKLQLDTKLVIGTATSDAHKLAALQTQVNALAEQVQQQAAILKAYTQFQGEPAEDAGDEPVETY